MNSFKGLCVACLLGLAAAVPMTAVPAVSQAASVDEIQAVSVNREGSNFKYWNDNAAAKEALVNYVKAVTDPNSPDFIPVEDRIVVSDMDGTFYCETAPTYSEWALYLHRILDDASYTPTKQEKAYAEECLQAARAESIPTDMDVGEDIAQSYAFQGMTLSEFDAYVDGFLKTPLNGLSNCTYGGAFYLPMLEVISYLNANDFTVYIVTGTDRQLVRESIKGLVPIQANHVIGTDSRAVASGQGFANGQYYEFSKDDIMVRGEYESTDNKMQKVSNIVREIGKQPILAFGNSGSDMSMLKYALSNNKYKCAAFGVCCDDNVRDWGNVGKGDKFRASCEKNGVTPISMKNDWNTIYGNGVTKVEKTHTF